MNEVGRCHFGPSHHDQQWDVNWTRCWCKYDGLTVFVDAERSPSHHLYDIEVFVPVGENLWYIGSFKPSEHNGTRTWHGIKRKAAWMIDKWLEQYPSEARKGKQPSGKEGATRWDISKTNGSGTIGRTTTADTASIRAAALRDECKRSTTTAN